MRGDQLEPPVVIPDERPARRSASSLGRDAGRLRAPRRAGSAPLASGSERVVEELEASGLVGYGGAGFPTGRKWEAVLREPAPRYVVVNADEGEPGTIKDRYVHGAAGRTCCSRER